MAKTVLGIIGGSGVYEIEGLENARWQTVQSPWGEPSDQLLTGTYAGVDLVDARPADNAQNRSCHEKPAKNVGNAGPFSTWTVTDKRRSPAGPIVLTSAQQGRA